MSDHVEPTGDRVNGLLDQVELDQIVESYQRLRPLQEIDQLAHEILSQRSALTNWEIERQRGATCFILAFHRLTRPIARGSTYEIYEAQHLFLGKVDVLKVLRRERAGPSQVAAHLRRARAQAATISEHIVRLYDAAFLRDVHHSIVERIASADLRSLVRQGPLSMDMAAAVVVQSALGIDAVHSRGLVYGHLKPTKILVGHGPNAKLCDAGVGEPPGSIPSLTAASGRVVDFLAPEVICGEEATSQSDVYSLGCVLYYAVTGKVPYPGNNEKEKRARHCYDYPLDPRRLAPGLDDSFVKIIAEMLEKEQRKRIPSMKEVISRLQPWIVAATRE